MERLMMSESPSFNDLMECIFKIKPNDINVYFYLLEQPGSTIDEISSFIRKDRSTAQRSIQSLLDKGIINREFRVRRSGGFRYVYNPRPMEEVKKDMEKELDIWHSMMAHLIKEFDKNKECETQPD